MLNNNILFSLFIGLISSVLIYLLTNRSKETKESKYRGYDILIIFICIFTTSFIMCSFKKGSGMNPVQGAPIPSSESMLSHSTRPPF